MTSTLLDNFEWLLRSHDLPAPQLYDAVAPQYEAFRKLWLDLAGAHTEAAMVADLTEVLKPGHRVLDAGCGTGAMSRQILDLQPGVRLTLSDASEGMMQQAGELGEQRVLADIAHLPFDDASFDVITCAWVIETLDDPAAAVTELLRVLRPDGFLLYTFCSLPQGWLSTAGSAVLRSFVTKKFAGQFLEPDEIPWHDCDRSRKVSFHGGLSTYILLRKCCVVSPGVLPKVAQADVQETLL